MSVVGHARETALFVRCMCPCDEVCLIDADFVGRRCWLPVCSCQFLRDRSSPFDSQAWRWRMLTPSTALLKEATAAAAPIRSTRMTPFGSQVWRWIMLTPSTALLKAAAAALIRLTMLTTTTVSWQVPIVSAPAAWASRQSWPTVWLY